ncbi:heme lyase CcmF/NrfE family subunit [Sansalvadorimonas sp. 2012CJ34-2]|uniref:Heme lyase CcmF/NrfE family subunit n=1 Tax=Parendozoicomonas callyspongiae TaxID=2942213 RepID=A0ABT0PKZ9_9GAMM|nr:heme lyase CcmF/NrfE family subunit [Sansalvadorimonas sp. 2012CJ34-2]MCL6271661.1 heme lyase CcmF/NrfE family subunit [Sansalvadorimonas sp. 2012CJ34-2]
MASTAGYLLLTSAFGVSILLTLLPAGSRWMSEATTRRLTGVLAIGQFLGLAGALSLLIYSMATLDFSLEYVVKNTSINLPMLYRITGTWGGHEGSLLLWTSTLAGWSFLFWLGSSHMNQQLRRITLSITAAVSLGFQALLVLSPPFRAMKFYIPEDGQGLNPMLQDAGLGIHPPTLYIGYAGISIVFAMVMAALILRLPVREWVREMQRTAVTAWGWLTLGIALGSWWAYLELGWGGWWFWDPAENASLMPWLSLSALLHAGILAKRNRKAAHTIAGLATATQALMLIGMFIVRSGIMSSVHSFTSDPTLGMTIITFIVLTTACGYMTQVLRPPVENQATSRYSRADMMIVAAIIFLVLACATVLLGTMYPFVLEVLDLGKISVGPAYFNTFFVPLTLITGAVLAYSSLRGDLKQALTAFLGAGLLAGSSVYTVIGELDWLAITSVTIALVILVAAIRELRFFGIRGGTVAHIGLALTLLGGTLSERGTDIMELRMWPGDSADLGGYSFEFSGTTPVIGPNYFSDFGFFDVTKDDEVVGVINPEKRLYPQFGQQVMTEAGNLPELNNDLYVALGEPFNDGSWAVRLRVIPFISLLWLGSLIMTFSCCRFVKRPMSISKMLLSYQPNTFCAHNNKSGEQA